jgi:DNA-directed RNA polymerase subunit E'/Rpb7
MRVVQVDGIVGGVLENGFFVDIGAMQAFISKNVSFESGAGTFLPSAVH